MLKLTGITKDYVMGNSTVNALKGITISFRENEFVSVLGPSGCGKTTLLNLIGGLDQYTDGDLVIDGVSTKKYKSKDWDAYRNHSVGFVFQNYNLIGHLTILKNVELALTLSGVGLKERKARATEALAAVGLEQQLNKKPNQLSGGQMQRVAIARAIVNNPKILLADEPTGALDSKTSTQIMDILKAIANDRLIVMVTHNPDLAAEYSTRIIRLQDGEMVGDTDPFETEEAKDCENVVREIAESAADEQTLTGIAGANSGEAERILAMQKGVECETSDKNTQGGDLVKSAENAVIGKINTSVNKFGATDEKTDKPNAEAANESESSEKAGASAEVAADQSADAGASAEVAADQSADAEFLKEVTTDELFSPDRATAETPNGGAGDGSNEPFDPTKSKKKKTNRKKTPKTSMSYFTALSLSIGNLLTKKGRTIVTAIAGSIGILGIALVLSISNGFNLFIDDTEQAIMTNQPVSIQQTTIDLEEMQNAMMDGSLSENDKFPTDGKVHPYDNSSMKNFTQYTNNLSDKFIKFMRDMDPTLYRSIDVLKNINFHVLAQNDDKSFAPMDVSANGSTSSLMSMFSGSGAKVSFNQMVNNKEYVNEHYEILKGKYPDNSNEVVLVLDSYNRVSSAVLSVLGYKNLEENVTIDFDEILDVRNEIKVLSNNQFYQKNSAGMYDKIDASSDVSLLQSYYDSPYLTLNIVGIMRVRPDDTSSMLSTGFCFKEEVTNGILDNAKVSEIVSAQNARIAKESAEGKKVFTSVISGEEFSLTNMGDLTAMNFNIPLLELVGISIPGLAEVSAINIYPTDLTAKDKIVERIGEWNAKSTTSQGAQIKYTDTMSFMFSSFQMILQAITYVLIAFVAISLIVSTVMIGIITYVSVIERTKEIGVLRAIGARKKDISRVFNAESVSIGFASGLIGVFVTWILLFPINLILEYFTEIPGLAILNPWHALILMAISMLLTFISGLIPARIASKKDPILALRTE